MGVVSCGEHSMKTASSHDECASSHQGAQEPDATLTKQTAESSHLEVEECGLQRDKQFLRFIEANIGERKLRSQHHSTTENTSSFAEFKVTPPPAVSSAGPQQQSAPSVVSKTDSSFKKN